MQKRTEQCKKKKSVVLMRMNDEQKVRMLMSDKNENECESENEQSNKNQRINVKTAEEKIIYINTWNALQMMTLYLFAKETMISECDDTQSQITENIITWKLFFSMFLKLEELKLFFSNLSEYKISLFFLYILNTYFNSNKKIIFINYLIFFNYIYHFMKMTLKLIHDFSFIIINLIVF